jgi:hypothetical protein
VIFQPDFDRILQIDRGFNVFTVCFCGMLLTLEDLVW